MGNDRALIWNDFGPELLKELWTWLPSICRKFTVQAGEPIYVTLLVDDKNGKTLSYNDVAKKDFVKIIADWQKRMRRDSVGHYPVIRQMPDFLLSDDFIEVECLIGYKS